MSSEYDSSGGDVGAYSDVLGEPVMVPNPMITAARAGAILDLTPHQVCRMVDNGLLQTHGPPNTVR